MWGPDGLCYAASQITDGREIEDVARTELGLTHRQAEWLFEANNPLEDLWYLARRLTHGEIDVPDDLPEIPDD
jgi:hypothetical protein